MRTRTIVSFLTITFLILPVLLEGARAQSSCTSNSDCDDGITCTVDLCDPDAGCVHLPAVGVPCQPDDRCLGPGRCEGAVCAPIGFPLNCDDTNPCTVDGCDPAT